MTTTAANLIDALRQSRCLKPAQLDELTNELLPQLTDRRSLAEELVRRGWLTVFQVNHLLQGRTLVLGPYLLLDRLGEGGMGEVFKARHQKMERIVAVKVIHKDRLANPDAVRRFHREVQAAAQLSHPNVVHAFDADQVGNTHLLVMEYVAGIDLAQYVKKHGPLPIGRVCEFVRQAALGLQHAHEKGLVHRDIKPHNLLLSSRALSAESSTPTTHDSLLTTHQVKILDMGLARIQRTEGGESSTSMTQTGTVMGTPDFIAPEQARDTHTADIRSDLYSLGCTLYFLLTAQVPFPRGSATEKMLQHLLDEPKPLEQLRPDVPAPVAAVVRKLMAKKPEERYQTPAELVAVLGPLASSPESLTATTVAPVAKPTSLSSQTQTVDVAATPRRRPRRRQLVVALAALLLLAGGGMFLLSSGPGQAPRLDSAVAEVRPTVTPSVTKPFRAEVLQTLQGHTGPVKSVAVSADGKRALSCSGWGGSDFTVRLWDLETGKEIRRIGEHTTAVQAVAFAPGDRRALSATAGGQLRLWDVETGKEVRSFEGHTSWINGVAFTPDGKAALSGGSGDNLLWLWDVGTGEALHKCTGNTGWINRVAASSDSRRALTSGHDNTLRLYDLTTGKEVLCMRGHKAQVEEAAFTPDGNQAVTASTDGTIRVWDLRNGKEIRSMEGHDGGVWSVAVSPDGKRVLSGGYDKTVRLWDLATGKEVLRLTGHTNRVSSVVFTTDGRKTLSGSLDGTVRLWSLPP